MAEKQRVYKVTIELNGQDVSLSLSLRSIVYGDKIANWIRTYRIGETVDTSLAFSNLSDAIDFADYMYYSFFEDIEAQWCWRYLDDENWGPMRIWECEVNGAKEVFELAVFEDKAFKAFELHGAVVGIPQVIRAPRGTLYCHGLTPIQLHMECVKGKWHTRAFIEANSPNKKEVTNG